MLQVDALLALLAASLEGGSMAVANGTARATAPLEEVRIEGAEVIVRATFSPEEANFEWSRREVLTAAGEVLDADDDDAGRKVAGAAWTVEVAMGLAVEEG